MTKAVASASRVLSSAWLVLLLLALSTRGFQTNSVLRQPTARRNAPSFFLSKENSEQDSTMPRRNFLGGIVSASAWAVLGRNAAHARGMVRFPCFGKMENTYIFMRAGTSLLEEQGIWTTNPLFLTNRETALSLKGMQQVEDAIGFLKKEHPDTSPSVVKYSLAAASIDTANMIGREFNIGGDRIMPEYTYMDPRAVGKWDMMPLRATQAAVCAMDVDEAGPEGRGGRPPENEDSTPHETLANQATRLSQLMCVMETSYSGDTILVAFPDGTGPALLSAMIAGIPFDHVHELDFAPGEVRVNVTMSNTLALWESKKQQQQEQYQQTLAFGRQELKRLRETPPEMNAKDQMIEAERLAIEAEYQRGVQERVQQKKEKERRALLVRKEFEASEMGEQWGSALLTGGILSGGAMALITIPNEKEEAPVRTVKNNIYAQNYTGASSYLKPEYARISPMTIRQTGPSVAPRASSSTPTMMTPSREPGVPTALFDEIMTDTAPPSESLGQINKDYNEFFKGRLTSQTPGDTRYPRQVTTTNYWDIVEDDGGALWLEQLKDMKEESEMANKDVADA